MQASRQRHPRRFAGAPAPPVPPALTLRAFVAEYPRVWVCLSAASSIVPAACSGCSRAAAAARQRDGDNYVGLQSAGPVLARQQIAQWLCQSRLTIVFERVDARAQRSFVGSHRAQSAELERPALALLAYAGRRELTVAPLAIGRSEQAHAGSTG